MTRVEFLQAVVDNNINDAVVEYAKTRLDKETTANAAKQADRDAKRQATLDNLTNEFQTAKEIAENTNYTAPQIQYQLNVLVKEGVVEKNDDTPKGYRLV